MSISTSSQKDILSFIREANSKGEHVTLEAIQKYTDEKPLEEHCHIITLGRILKRWGFEFGKGKKTQHLKEKDITILKRKLYIRKMRNNYLSHNIPNTIKPEVYLDES